MENSKVGGSVTNSIEGKNLTNTATGNKSEANMGSVKMK
jgi:hypothetical protein